MLIRYSKQSAPSARLIAEESSDIEISREGVGGDVNWGRARANTSLNPDITNSTNKRVMRSLFKTHDVPMPELLTLEEAEQHVNARNNGVLIGRPDRHMKGRGYWRVTNPSQYYRAIRGTRRKRAATHFMRFVEADREYRVHVFRDKSIRISEKSFFNDERGNRDYVTVKPQHRIKHVRKAAKKAVAALGLDFGAVDVLATEDECWVLEVNAAPGLGGTMPRVYAETFLAWENGEYDD